MMHPSYHALIDAAWYLTTYPDIAEIRVHPSSIISSAAGAKGGIQIPASIQAGIQGSSPPGMGPWWRPCCITYNRAPHWISNRSPGSMPLGIARPTPSPLKNHAWLTIAGIARRCTLVQIRSSQRASTSMPIRMLHRPVWTRSSTIYAPAATKGACRTRRRISSACRSFWTRTTIS